MIKNQPTPFSKSKTFVFIILALLGNLVATAQSWQWAISNTGANSDYAKKTCSDPSGNIFLAGNFSSSPFQLGSISLNNAGLSGSDGFIAKLDQSGNVLWAQRIGGTNNEYINGICSDASGNVYVVGQFNSSGITISPYSIGNYTTSGSYDIFVACYNSSGTIQWLKSFGNVKDDYASACVYSNSLSALYIGGAYYSASVTVGTNTLTNTSATGTITDVFLARLTNTGSVTWAKTTGSSNSNEGIIDVTIDSNSDVLFCGNFSPGTSTTVIGATTLTTTGGQDMYFSKYNSAGTPQWSKNFGTSFNGSGDFVGGMCLDPSNNIYLTGTYIGASLIAGSFTLTNTGGYDSFIAKTNSTGTFQWANKIAATQDEYSNGIAIDGGNNLYVTGAFTGTNLVVGTTTIVNSNPGSTQDVYVLKYNPTGTVAWANTAKGADNENASGISADINGNVFVCGNIFTAPTAFGNTTLTTSGSTEAFVAKIGCLTTTISGFSTVCNGSSVTLTANGAATYTWSTLSNSSSIAVSPTATTVYSLSGSNGSCIGTSSTFTVNWLPASLSAGPNLTLQCNQTQVLSPTCNPAGPVSVNWSPATNLNNPSALNPTVTAAGPGIIYTVSVVLNNGCNLSNTVSIVPFAPTPDICMVTVDSLGLNNEIYWDKTNYPMLDSMIIFRETSTNIYKRIGAVSRVALSMFVDTLRSIGPSNGDPKISTYRYKIQMRDSCGNYSQKSLWHNTVYFTNNNGTFLWTNNYQIEGTPLPTNPVVNYSLVVFPNPTLTPLTYSIVGVTAGNQNSLADPNYTAYANTADWRVEANLGYQCQPTNKAINSSNQVLLKATKSRSNIQNNKTSGIKEFDYSRYLNVYPNPASSLINITIDHINKTDLVVLLRNVLGQEVKSTMLYDQSTTLNVSELKSGIYFIEIKDKDKTVAVSKIILSK